MGWAMAVPAPPKQTLLFFKVEFLSHTGYKKTMGNKSENTHGTNPIFRQTCETYLKKIRSLDLSSIAQPLGLIQTKDDYQVQFLGKTCTIGRQNIYDDSGRQTSYDTTIVLCRYLIMGSQYKPEENDMVSFRDLKDSGPLTVFFSNDVEKKLCHAFSGRLDHLKNAARKLGASPVTFSADYDLSVQINVLPKIPIAVLFNDKDELFDAKATLLFERCAEHYLDAECLAILGSLLVRSLIRKSQIC